MSSTGIHIAAGGYGTRLRSHMQNIGYDNTFPKHLLPTGGPNGETFLGRIIRQVAVIPDALPPVVYINEDNKPHIASHPDLPTNTELRTHRYANSFEPMIDALISTNKRVVGCAGDYYADPSWGDLLEFHDSTKYPITFVAGYTAPVEGGLSYEVAPDSRVVSFKRSAQTEGHEMINVGIYVFDPTPRALAVLASVKQAKEEVIAQRLVDEQLLGLYILPTLPFNVNTEMTYQLLLQHTARLSLDQSLL